MLLKCMVLQKWFHIPSDPELENRINDRISFEKFLRLPLDKSMTRSFSGEPDPKHSTFRILNPPGQRHFQDSAADYRKRQ